MRNLKTTIKSFASAVGRLSVVSAIVDRPSVHGLLEKIPGSHILYGNGWDRLHPFDRRYGTDTSGYVPAEELLANESFRDDAFPYAGSQPSVLRLALAALPPVDSCTFLDLGCGKGRALLVASEFPFRDICGGSSYQLTSGRDRPPQRRHHRPTLSATDCRAARGRRCQHLPSARRRPRTLFIQPIWSRTHR